MKKFSCKFTQCLRIKLRPGHQISRIPQIVKCTQIRIMFLFVLFSFKTSFAQTWSSPGPPLVVASAGVNTFVEYNNELFTTGVNHLTKFNGTSWSNVYYISNWAVEKIWTMVVYNNELYVCGTFTSFAGVPADNIVKYNGSSWSAVGGGLDTTACMMEVYNGELYVCGYNGQALKNGNALVKWNGTSWNPAGTVNTVNGTIYDMEVYNNELVVTGFFNNIGGISASYVAKFNGTNWSTLGSGLNSYGLHICKYNTDLVIGGALTAAGGSPAARIAKWNGSSWSALGSGVTSGGIVYTVHQYQGTLYAGGTFSAAGGQTAVYIATWNGSSWNDCGSTQGNQNCVGVYGMVTYQGALFVGGLFDGIAGVLSGNVIKYQGAITGFDEKSVSDNISVYPNPVKESLIISADSPVKIMLRDVSGKLLLEKLQEAGEEKLNLEWLWPGVYFVEISGKDELQYHKIIKE